MPSAPLAHHFYTMACNNAWANHRLLTACSRSRRPTSSRRAYELLPLAQGDAQPHPHRRLVLRRRARARRLHAASRPIATSMRFFEPEEPVRDLRGARARATRRRPPPGRRVRRARPTIALDDCRCPVDAPRGHRSTRTPTRLLAHLFQHQIHHRGQAHAMLAGTASSRRSSTNSSARTRRTCARRSSPSSGLSEAAIWGDALPA